MFSIKFIADNMGEIKINDFEEKFEIATDYWPRLKYEQSWRKEIQYLLNNTKDKIALMTWMHKPMSKGNYRAYVLYGKKEKVFIQEQLFPASQSCPNFDTNEALSNIQDQFEINEEGNKISQWEISINDLKLFIENS